MPKAKLYLLLGLILFAGVGALLFINGTKRYQVDTVPEQTDLEESSQTEKEGALPSDFPQDFPIYPEAKLESSYQSKGDEVKATSVVWLARASLESVSGFYKSELVKSGRKINSALEDENSAIISFEKGKEEGFIGIGTKDNNIVVISVSFGASFEEPSI